MRRSLLSASLTCFVFAWAVLWPDVARAADPTSSAAAATDPDLESARHHFEAGRAAYAANDFQTSIREFKAAEALKPSPLLSYNIGLANEKLGRRRVAVSYYKRYLDSAPGAPNRAEVQGRISTLEHGIAVQPGSGAAPAEQPLELPSNDPPPSAMAPSVPPPSAEVAPAPDQYAPQAPVMTARAKPHRRWWVGLVIGLSVAAVVATIITIAVVESDRHHNDNVSYDAKVRNPVERGGLFDHTALPSTARGAETAPLVKVRF